MRGIYTYPIFFLIFEGPHFFLVLTYPPPPPPPTEVKYWPARFAHFITQNFKLISNLGPTLKKSWIRAWWVMSDCSPVVVDRFFLSLPIKGGSRESGRGGARSRSFPSKKQDIEVEERLKKRETKRERQDLTACALRCARISSFAMGAILIYA